MQKLLTFVAAGLSSLAVPASAEVVQKSEGGFVIRVAGEVAAAPLEVWKAFTNPARWWSNAHTFSGDANNLTLDPSANGCFCEKMPIPKDAPSGQPPGSVMHMRVLYAEPHRALRMNGGLGPLQSEAVVGTMTVTFKPVEGLKGKGTRILWEYVVGGFMRYKTDTIAGGVDKVLTDQLVGLIKLLGPLQTSSSEVEPLDVGREDIAPADTEPSVPAPALSDADAGEAVKTALDKIFRKKEEDLRQ